MQSIGGDIKWGDRTDLIEQYESYEARMKEREKRKLTGQDIGMAGFGIDVKECDWMGELIDRLLAEIDEREET